MKQTRSLSEFSCLSEYTRIYPNDSKMKQYIDFFQNSIHPFENNIDPEQLASDEAD